MPGDPFATHVINVLHLLLPAGERWFVSVLKQALPLIRDEKIRSDVLGFIGQEAVHAEAHHSVLEHLPSQGLDPTPYTRQIEWFFERILGDRELTGKAAEEWLVERLAIIAAIEHVTAFLGQWVLDARALDEIGADPTMLDLLRWHGAEEVEHRSVAFDLYMHVDGRYLRRVRAMLVVAVVMSWLWARGVRFLMRTDPHLRGLIKPRWRDLRRTRRLGRTPGYLDVLRSLARYFRRSYHPSQEGSTEQAVAYLAVSPAARAAEHR
ncbi:metal-dependent hydrolase [Longimycelium tulufanense]|uniref:Metal-dependent hydrolase n=1 Tax=Longimycelium tulufanense TaxID=907463 RepID=A0A8J3CE71_9PSEU|nr:metal-dependent hydrolase [Longimycelium tulufanense]